jgi:hypothetical protein
MQARFIGRSDEESFRERMRSKIANKQVAFDLASAQKTCRQLDEAMVPLQHRI